MPSDVNMVIEMQKNSKPVKYEFDYASGTMEVNRLLNTSHRYPGDYGFIPHTLSEDGDAVDVLLMMDDFTLMPNSFVSVRPIGVLFMEDESGNDEKVIAVPSSAVSPYYDGSQNYTDLNSQTLQRIEDFFGHYKDLDPDKHTIIHGWGDVTEAHRVIQEGIQRHAAKYPAQKSSPPPPAP